VTDAHAAGAEVRHRDGLAHEQGMSAIASRKAVHDQYTGFHFMLCKDGDVRTFEADSAASHLAGDSDSR
jgi:hypothetical protein